MTLQTRIEALEARQRKIEAGNEPNCFQHAEHDGDGSVFACERFCFPPPGTLPPGMLGGVQAFANMTREPFSRETCHYVECEHRPTCRADGSLTKWGAA